MEDASGVRTVQPGAASVPLFDDVVDVDAVALSRRDGSEWLVAAGILASGADHQVVLSYGPADAAVLTTILLEGPNGDLPLEIAVWANEEEVVVGVTPQAFGRPVRVWLGTYPWAD